jgi:hypothetical protein
VSLPDSLVDEHTNNVTVLFNCYRIAVEDDDGQDLGPPTKGASANFVPVFSSTFSLLFFSFPDCCVLASELHRR